MPYERLQIESLLKIAAAAPHGTLVQRGVGLHLMPDVVAAHRTFEIAVIPAMEKNGIDARGAVCVFDSSSNLAEVARWLMGSELVVADLSVASADLFYVMGLAHGLRRCPLIVTPRASDLPFNLAALRRVDYEPGTEGLIDLRARLTRAIRVFLAAARSGAA